MRPTETFIIPGKIINVSDIKRLKGESERERESGGGLFVWEWMVVKGGVAWHEEAELGEKEQEMRAGGKRTNSSDQ